MYQTNTNYKTPIDDLLDLDAPGNDSEGMGKYKAIRTNMYGNSNNTKDNAKMLMQNREYEDNEYLKQNYSQQYNQQFPNNYQLQSQNQIQLPTQMYYPTQDNFQLPKQQHLSNPYPQQMCNCIDIANHIKDCPICSKFYDNDKTVYIVIIVLLTIICLLLLKRVLNV